MRPQTRGDGAVFREPRRLVQALDDNCAALKAQAAAKPATAGASINPDRCLLAAAAGGLCCSGGGGRLAWAAALRLCTPDVVLGIGRKTSPQSNETRFRNSACAPCILSVRARAMPAPVQVGLEAANATSVERY